MKFLVLILALSVQLALGQSLDLKVPQLTNEESSGTPIPVEGPPEGNLPGPIVKIRPSTSQTARDASRGTVMVGHQAITSWLPSKNTLSYTHIFSERWTLEGEYSFQTINTSFIGVDLGKISERRTTLHARRYFGNSFHLSFGAVLSTFEARLGGVFVDSLGDRIQSSFRAQNLGVSGGLGNRWQWDNGLTLGVDWLRINVPMLETRVDDNVLDSLDDSDNREDVKGVIRTFSRIPTFVLLGLNIGYTF